MRQSPIRFIRQQGFLEPNPPTCWYSALMLQPRIIGGLVALGVLLQSPWLFLSLSAVLWWSALVPAFNPFDALHNYLVAYPRGLPLLGAAPAPRRFAQGVAASLSLAIAAALARGAAATAWTLESLFVLALIALIFGRFCVGSYLYHVLRRGLSSYMARLKPDPTTGT